MAFEPSLAGFDRDIAHADEAWTRWQARLREAPTLVKDEEPLGPWRHVAGRNAYQAVHALAPTTEDAPWREALLRWTLELTQRRIATEPLLEWELEADEATLPIRVGPPRLISYRQAWGELLQERERPRVAALLDAAAGRGPKLASLAHRAAQRRVEVARRLELAQPLSLSISMSHGALRALASDVLACTADLAGSLRRESRGKDAPDAIDALLAAVVVDAPEGWPSRLTTRWLQELFGDLAKGLPLRVSVPPAYGAASFARALGAFGYALRTAGASRSLPFALARDPHPVDAHRYALVFAALPASPAFQRRSLGNVARIARKQARRLAVSALFEARAIAARALLTDDQERTTSAFFEEVTTSLFGSPLPTRLAGAWPRARGDEWMRLLALLTARPFADDLVERFDIDWFANPRAMTYLRARASAPARAASDSEPVVAQAARHLAAAFEEALG